MLQSLYIFDAGVVSDPPNFSLDQLIKNPALSGALTVNLIKSG